jgi:prepilin-type processing-associated H-X9-DG protein
MSNIRQLLQASLMYANDHDGYWPPAEADGGTTNLQRWHGSRLDVNTPFAFSHAPSPLKEYLETDQIKACPSLRSTQVMTGFEAGAGGYGYEESFVGSSIESYGPIWPLPDDAYARSAKLTQIRRSSAKIAFADTAFGFDWTNGPGLYEYSFVEAPLSVWGAQWPSIHFRHGAKSDRANIGWADGHVTSEPFEWTLATNEAANWYGIDFASHHLGWFGPHDNSLFQRE